MISKGLSFALAAAVSSATVAAERLAAPDLADIAALEQVAQLPKGAEPVRAYARYYSRADEDGRAILVGSYLLDAPDPPGPYIGPVPVHVMDGGCAVVTVRFDLSTRRQLSAWCNGVA